MMALVRRGVAQDLEEIRAIQQASPEAAQWDPADYLAHDLLVCIVEGAIVGFAVMRQTAPAEFELLNLAVSPRLRRRGIARRLIEALLQTAPTGVSFSVFLEVRESNRAAQTFYNHLNFQELGLRRNYYENPPEAAIVMKFHSC